MKQIIQYCIIGLLTVFAVQSCDPDKVFENNVEIPDSEWHRSTLARFEVDINDTINGCNLYVNIRNNSEYKYMDFWMFINTTSPTGITQRDTVKIRIADDHGKWLGHGLGDKYDNRMLLRKNVRFPVSGTYIFEYEQGMRDDPITGINDIGLRIEKTKQN